VDDNNMQGEQKELDEKRVENIDVLDENGNVTMKRYPRSEVHRLGLWHRVAHVWIVNQKGELIVQKRTNTKESWPSLWDVSSAGHCDAGENSLTTVILIENEICIYESTKRIRGRAWSPSFLG